MRQRPPSGAIGCRPTRDRDDLLRRRLRQSWLPQTCVFGANWFVTLDAEREADRIARTHGRDAVWLGHAWVDGRRGEVDVAALARRLCDTGVRDLYVYTGPLGADGRMDP